MEKPVFAGVMDEDPYFYRTWSGSSPYFFRALEAEGALFRAVAAEPGRYESLFYKLLNFYPEKSKWRFRYHLDTSYFGARSRVGLQALRDGWDHFNTFLQVGAWYDMTQYGKCAVSYHDGNLARRLDNPYGYPQISRSRIDRALRYEKALYERMSAIFPMSRWLANSFIKDFGVSEDKVFPVYAGINMPDVEVLPERDYSNPDILFVGRDFDRKGGTVLLDAFKIIKRNRPDATLTLVGPDMSSPMEGIECKGFIRKDSEEGQNQLRELYLKAGVFVIPTLYEPFGIAFAEAMAHGLPCVGTEICAIPEIITGGKSGFLVPPRSVDDLAKAILDILGDQKMAREFGQYGFERYRQDFRWEAVSRKIIDTTARLL